jgi:hypothetical protein
MTERKNKCLLLQYNFDCTCPLELKGEYCGNRNQQVICGNNIAQRASDEHLHTENKKNTGIDIPRGVNPGRTGTGQKG